MEFIIRLEGESGGKKWYKVEVVLDQGEDSTTVDILLKECDQNFEKLEGIKSGVYEDGYLPFRYPGIVNGTCQIPDNAVTEDMVGKTGISITNNFSMSLLRHIIKKGVKVHFDKTFNINSEERYDLAEVLPELENVVVSMNKK